ncbi:MAG: HD domain-containing protein [Chloroflexi bacterium]|nr:MAG: HD domain-containing protein [Chloroflexota bacterium]
MATLRRLRVVLVISHAIYRVRQVWISARPALRASEVLIVRERLNDAERALFVAMDPRDRRHSMDVLQLLRQRGTPSATLETAALLHDIGKGQMHLHERVLFVLIGVVSSRLRHRLEREGQRGLRGAFWRLRHHPEIGAVLLNDASTERVCWLVLHHTDRRPPDDAELLELIAADSVR